MDILLYALLFVVSLAVLLKAADWFIDAAETIGLNLGIPPFIIGVTIVAFGTSLPELATSIASVYAGESAIVVGNVIGSNITNIALVLGLTAFYVKEVYLEKSVWNIDLPYLLGSSFLLWFVLRDQQFSLFEAILFFIGIIIFLAYSFSSNKEEEVVRTKIRTRTIVFLILGGTLVYFGADYTIFSIKKLSSIAGISPEVIALTAVALGTSLPEVIVSLNASRKGKTSIAVGNVLGSNIFNTYAVMSIPSFFGTLDIPDGILTFSLPLMIVMTVLFGIMCISMKISRWEGLFLLMFYTFFVVELFDKL
jgi:cation:H+ antiporter